MSAKAKKKAPSPTIQIASSPELRAIEVVKGAAFQNPAEDFEVNLNLKLTLNRLATNVLGVELTLRIANVPDFSAYATYRAVFTISNAPDDPDELDRALRAIGGRVGPNMLYPFLRETIATAMQKALMPALIPPLVNFDQVFDLETMTVPAQPDKPVRNQ